MPNIQDPYFSESVILLCEHTINGAMGFIINKSIDTLVLNQIIEKKYFHSLYPKMSFSNIFFGGPVLLNKGLVLHRSHTQRKNSIKISEEISITDYKNANDLINEKNIFKYKLLLGHAGWSAGQLEQEIKKGDWLIQNASPDFIFGTPPKKMWQDATSSLGINSGSMTKLNAKA